MATLEFIEKRIAGKKAEIEKLEKKLERIETAKATGWKVNPYYYMESDLKYTTRDLEKAKEALAQYEAELETGKENANSRNIQVIIDFLNMWKKRVTDYYETKFDEFIVAQDKRYEENHAYCDWYNHGSWKLPKEEREAVEKKEREAKRRFNETWAFIEPYVIYGHGKRSFDDAKLAKDLNAEADRKYDFIIERTNAIVGQITDANELRIGDKGDLNGYILGTRGTAKVQTIGAGGYNIQCFHFRTLIHKA